MDRKIIFSLFGNMLIAFGVTFFLPIIYALFILELPRIAIFFLLIGISTTACGIFFWWLGKNHRRRLPVAESATAMLFMYPLLAIFGMIPFVVTNQMLPLDALLETVSDLTSAGISILPQNAPYIFRLWQSILMWFGSMIFLIMLVTLMPEVSGSFGLDFSLHGGQIFSPMFGQMFSMAKKIGRIYATLTLISFFLFKLAGLDFWNSTLMAMRCISTGGGDFFAGRGNIFVEYAAVFTMLMACGNFLFYHRLLYTIPPAERKSDRNIFFRAANYLKSLKKNIFYNIGHFFRNSEVKAVCLMIFLCVGFIFLSNYLHGNFTDGNVAFRYAIFHVVSFLSTTGMSLASIDDAHDFDQFLIFLTAIFGGCIGSVTGGLKIIRVIVLAKVFAAELQKVMHPHMVINIRVNNFVVPAQIVGRILGFFFLVAITLFVCSAILSFTGTTFSEGVGISLACLTNVGNLPGVCEPHDFLELTTAGKIFCALILIVGRLEIFALLIFVANLKFRHSAKGKW